MNASPFSAPHQRRFPMVAFLTGTLLLFAFAKVAMSVLVPEASGQSQPVDISSQLTGGLGASAAAIGNLVIDSLT